MQIIAGVDRTVVRHLLIQCLRQADIQLAPGAPSADVFALAAHQVFDGGDFAGHIAQQALTHHLQVADGARLNPAA
ncbi:hypothetical protein [Pseudomonas sp. 34 E 7]|nr:hypothetical protein [Pseudomonas sp. 34 E 7]